MSENLSRRGFLGHATSAAALASLTALPALTQGCASLTQTAPLESGIIDTHTHFYDPTRSQGVPWPGREDAFLYRPVLPPEFESLARPLGVTTTVVVEASPWLEDNQWLLDLTRRYDGLIGVVGHLKPGSPEFASALLRFRKNRRFRGVRLGGNEAERAARDPYLRRDLARLVAADLALDVLVEPEQLPAVAALAGAVPDLRIVLDHCGNVAVDGRTPPDKWVDGVRRCAAQPRVFVKVSGLVEGTGRRDGEAPRELAFYRPVLDVLWQAFGPDRLLFASNWPVSARFASYETVFRIVQGYFTEKGSGVARRFFTENAVRVYGLRGSRGSSQIS